MKFGVSLCLTVVLCLAGTVVIGADDAGEWTVPDCDRIVGTNAITFTTDDGLSLADAGTLRQPTWTFGLVALDEANTLVAAVWGDDGAVLVRSEDAGCKWQRLGEIPGCAPLSFTASPDGTIYAWTPGREAFYRIQGKVVTALEAPDRIYGVAIDPMDALHIRIGSTDCQIYESRNGGKGFFKVGKPAMTYNGVYFAVDFDPTNWDCALCGTKGGFRTTDAGQTWYAIRPFDKDDIDITYHFVYSPVNPQRVWVRAKMETMNEGPEGIFVSNDGGATFDLVVKEGTIVTDQNGIPRLLELPNMPTMAAHPRNSDVFYFLSSNAYDNYGTDFYRFDLSANNLYLAHIDGLDGINSMDFNPVDPSVIYFGMEQTILGVTETGVTEEQPGESVNMAVSPNPFNPSANISFSLPEAAQVKLNVYNLVGRKVATLVDEYMSAGEHTVSWDAGRYASGIYLARLETGSVAETKKLVLLK